MRRTITMPATYRQALEDLVQAQNEVQGLAELLELFAGLLRGARPDFGELTVEAYPTPSRVRRALEGRERAWQEARRVYEALPWDLQETLLPPEEQLGSL